MLNMNRENLIHSIENIKKDSVSRIEWNLEYLYVDYEANRGHPFIALARAYELVAQSELDLRKVRE